MLVARHPEVVGTADVGAELDRVAALQPREVRHDLPLLLVLRQRAVAAIHAEAGTKPEIPRTAGSRIIATVVVFAAEQT